MVSDKDSRRRPGANAGEITLEWFTEVVSRMSRQTLTTMGKRAGFKPFSRRGRWRFRDAAGEELDLAQVFQALEDSSAGRAWLRERYEYPIRSARAAEERTRLRERELVARLTEAYDFLVTDNGYKPPFPIVAHVADCVILGYRNPRAARQVEVSGNPEGYGTHCEIRRLLDGEPGEYGPHSIAIWELRMVREPGQDPDEPQERDAALRRNTALLRRHEDILDGTGWIDRDHIERVVSGEWFGKLGIFPPGRDEPSMLDVARRHADLLVKAHGFTLEFDSDALSPHETQMWRELRYRRGDTTIRIVNSDIRVQLEWSLQMNGRSITELRGDFEEWLVEALNKVTRSI